MKKILSVILFAWTLGMLASIPLNAQSFTDDEKANTFSMKEVDSPPKPAKQDAPSVPGSLSGIAATVHVGFIIDGSGNVIDARIIKTTDDRFNDISVSTVSGWMFEPATKGGSGVSVRVIIPLRYK